MQTFFALVPEDLAEVEANLRRQYKGVFDEQLIELHVREFIKSSLADRLAGVLAQQTRPGESLLDIGCGYGAFVLACRSRGVDAGGYELAPFEVAMARRRLTRMEPATDPAGVFREGDAGGLPFGDAEFDRVTLLNVLEHVPDFRQVLSEAIRVLRPGGCLHVVCPNYAALRQEAHYHVPWLPFFPRRLASAYLRMLGRNPAFFEEHIHYCSNWGVLRALRGFGMSLSSMDLLRIDYPELLGSTKARGAHAFLSRIGLLPFARLLLWLNFYNPFKAGVNVTARKRAHG